MSGGNTQFLYKFQGGSTKIKTGPVDKESMVSSLFLLKFSEGSDQFYYMWRIVSV